MLADRAFEMFLAWGTIKQTHKYKSKERNKLDKLHQGSNTTVNMHV